MTCLQAALEYAARGWPVFGLTGFKKPYANTHGVKDATTDADLIRAMWDAHPYANVAIALGAMVVIDADGPGGEAQWRALQEANGHVVTASVKTARGHHYYFLAPEGVRFKNFALPRPKGSDGIDVKAINGYVLAPPSINRAKRWRYVWDCTEPVAAMPQWLVAWVLEYVGPARPTPRTGAEQPAFAIGTPPYRAGTLARRVWKAQQQFEFPNFLQALRDMDPPESGYNTWFEIGAAIYDFDSTNKGLAVFKAVSWRAEQYRTEEAQIACEKKWIEYEKRKGSPYAKSKNYIYELAATARSRRACEATKNVAVSNATEAIESADAVTVQPQVAKESKSAIDVFSLAKALAWSDIDANGIPKSTTTNARIALQRLAIACQKDVFHERLLVGGEVIDKWAGNLSDDVVVMLRKIIKERFRFDPGERNMRDAAVQLCLEHQFNPVTDYLDSLQWDGVRRIDTWVCTYLGAANTALNREIGKLMLVAAVRRARQPGCKFDEIIVLEGREGTGKSEAIRILAGDDNFSDQSILSVSDKEQQEAMTGVWLYEIAELAGMRRTDVERIKQFASRREDRARPAYGRFRIDRKRQCVFVGTTNDDVYLMSDNGDRRIWPLLTSVIDLAGLLAARDQLWAEASHLEQQGHSIRLRRELWEAAAEAQNARRAGDVWVDPIWESVKGKTDTSVHEILTNGHFHMDNKDINRAHQMRVSSCLKQMGWVRYRHRNGVLRVWRYRLGPVGDKVGDT